MLAWIKAGTCFAICFLYIISTTSSTIPSTSTIVVFIITPAIFCPMRGTTATSTFTIWVKTFAFAAIVGLYISSTTISPIICTSTIVVIIITKVVSFPLRWATSTRAIRWWWCCSGCWWGCWRWRFSTNISNLSYKKNMLL